MLDGGHHRDLEEEHQQEQAQEDVALEQDAGEQLVVQSLQLQILAKDEEAVDHKADRQVGVQDVQQPRLDVEVLTIFRGNLVGTFNEKWTSFPNIVKSIVTPLPC